MNDIVFWTIVLIGCEIFEGAWQRSNTLMDALDKIHVYYKKSIFLFFAMHPSFYIVLLIVLATGVFNFIIIFIVAFKIFDLFTKIELMRQIYYKKVVSKIVLDVLMRPLSQLVFFVGVILYPPFLYMAMNIG